MPQKNNKPNYWGDDVTSFFRMSFYLCSMVLMLTVRLFHLDVVKEVFPDIQHKNSLRYKDFISPLLAYHYHTSKLIAYNHVCLKFEWQFQHIVELLADVETGMRFQ
ncbi:hypothetical protein [Nostoc sp. FACHB-133]|uniref:hypothetical protein n=1 Tax=Nostoc sp. FACHB-133 TaxID=2692835 RepID=UPI0016888BF8|nr:hypothetical protein [Nostoc sp. FACHB-133]MBD2527974.1 hypothetical protein [Nostoc sp. FACHB-133]